MIILYVVSLYLIAGVIFAIPFLIKWITYLDEAARDSPWTLKLTVLPGTLVFWPLLLRKLNGSLIYGDGTTLLQLTEEDNLNPRVHPDPVPPRIWSLGPVVLEVRLWIRSVTLV